MTRHVVGRCVLAVLIAGGLASGAQRAAAQAPRWELTDRLQIGTALGDLEYEFGNIGGVAELENGVMVVAETQSSEIRFYDANGRHILSQGREGQGPGEYLFPIWVGACAPDSVFVIDGHQDRMTVLTAEGHVARVTKRPTSEQGRGPYEISCDVDGNFAVAGWPDQEGAFEDPTPGPYSTTFTVVTANRQGELERVIGEFSGGDRVLTSSGGRVTGSGPRYLAPRTHVAVHRDQVFVADASEPRVLIVTGTGRRAVPVPFDPATLTKDDLREFTRERIEAVDDPDRRRAATAYWAEYPFPSQYPFFSDLKIDSNGMLWVRSYPRVGHRVVTWVVVDPGIGRPIATLEAPAAFEVEQIGSDSMVGTWRDSMGVQYVRRYGIVKPLD